MSKFLDFDNPADMEAWRRERDAGKQTAVVPDVAGANDDISALRQQRKYNPVASARGKKRQKQGARGEAQVRRVLAGMGFVRIERLKTYWDKSGRYAHKAKADFEAIENGSGRYVLVEAKDIEGDTLPHSAIRKHQKTNLTDVHHCGGISLLAITHGRQTAVIPWGAALAAGVMNRGSIAFDWALSNRINK